MQSPAFEKVLDQVGSCGRWQLTIFLWTTVGVTLTAFHNLSSVFLAADPSDFRCAVPADNVSIREAPLDEVTLSAWLPRDNLTGHWSQCERYASAEDHTRLERCESWIFPSDSRHTWTVVMQWSLVCHRRWLVASIQSTYMAGSMMGALADGVLSDHFGRKWTACVSALALGVSSMAAAAASTSLVLFIVLRFVSAVAQAGLFGSLFVLCLELVGVRRRALVGLGYELPFAAGFMLLAGLAYWVRNWQLLQLLVSAPSLLLLVYWIVLPESPRWLALKGRHDEALTILARAAKCNNRSNVDESLLRDLLDEVYVAEKTRTGLSSKSCEASDRGRVLKSCSRAVMRVLQLLRTPRMRIITLASFTNWLVVAMVYYGVTFDAAKLSSSRYLSIFLSGLIEVPAYLISVPAADRFGRRRCVIAAHSVTAAALLLILAVPNSWPSLRMALGLAGKFAATACFGILYLYAAEYFPTTVRTIGVGCSSMCARVGSILAPIIVEMVGAVHWAIPSAVFGCSACAAAVVALALPETNQYPMPDTVKSVENEHWNPRKPSAGHSVVSSESSNESSRV